MVGNRPALGPPSALFVGNCAVNELEFLPAENMFVRNVYDVLWKKMPYPPRTDDLPAESSTYENPSRGDTLLLSLGYPSGSSVNIGFSWFGVGRISTS